jgi:hypothetical protein
MSTELTPVSELAWKQGIADLNAAARWGAADPETIEATLGWLRRGDHDTWLMEWTAVAGKLWARPDTLDPASSFLAAASYYAAALALIDGTDGSVSEERLWRRQRECWDLAVDALGGEQLSVPFERVGLPAQFFSGGSGRRPLIIVDHGGRVATSSAWIQGGAAARARGFHWMTFDGPGRQAARRCGGLELRTDWETVIDAVLKLALARPDVDPSRIALIGADHAGLGVARALITERRLTAAAVLPGIVDASTPLVMALPAAARAALLDDDRGCFDEELRLASLFSPSVSSRLRRLVRDYGHDDEPLFGTYRRALRFRLDECVSRIQTPLAIASQEDGGLWPGQAYQLSECLEQAHLLGEIETGDDAAIDWLEGEF